MKKERREATEDDYIALAQWLARRGLKHADAMILCARAAGGIVGGQAETHADMRRAVALLAQRMKGAARETFERTMLA